MRIKFKTYGINILKKPVFKELVLLYATDFWAGVWKELLRDEMGRQYGTYNERGEIYSETKDIIAYNQVSIDDPHWPKILWDKAGRGELKTRDGLDLFQFWSFSQASDTLKQFVSPTHKGGYGGKIIVGFLGKNPVSFTAFTTTVQYYLIDKRFPTKETITLSNKVIAKYGDNQMIGLFLDFAVSEKLRGQKIGSKLFDERIKRLKKSKTTLIIGRTLKTSPAQYFGNYLKRGLIPFASDPNDNDKVVFVTPINNLLPRNKLLRTFILLMK